MHVPLSHWTVSPMVTRVFSFAHVFAISLSADGEEQTGDGKDGNAWIRTRARFQVGLGKTLVVTLRSLQIVVDRL